MSETYCVRLPLEFPDSYQIDGLDLPAKIKILDHSAQLSVEEGKYLLTVNGIESEEEARIFLRKLHAGICWASLELKTGIRATPEPQKIMYSDDPEKAGKQLMLRRPVDVVIDTAWPAIVHEGARIAKISAGSARIIASTKPKRFFAALMKGLERANPEVFADGSEAAGRIESAIELYVLSYFERNLIPRFLLQCTALEVLAPPGEEEPAHVVAQVEAWVNAAQTLIGKQGISESKQEDFKRLARKAEQLTSISHGERIRRFARQALSMEGASDIEDKIMRLMDAYGVRSRFLHDGKRKRIGSAATDMHEILPLLLKAALKGGNNSGG